MKALITAILVLVTHLLFGQSFKGKLVYNTNYQIEIPDQLVKMGVTKETLIEKMKKEGSYSDSIKTTYKQGSYVTFTNFTPCKSSAPSGLK